MSVKITLQCSDMKKTKTYRMIIRYFIRNVYIVTCSDHFPKWPETGAISDKSARSVADFLYKLITIHGSPAIVQYLSKG